VDPDVIVVGAGHNGLVAAAYLARAGLRVVMFERLPHVGGAAVTEELWPGFRFSPCAHMVHAIHPRIIRDLRLRERGFEVLSRGPWRRFQPNGTYFGATDDASPRNLAYADRLTPEEREGIRQLDGFRGTLGELLAPYRLRTPPRLAEVRGRAAGTPAAAVLEQALTMTVSQLHAALLPTERLEDRFATDAAAAGRDPLALTYGYSSISRPDEETGEAPPLGYVRGGTGSFSRILGEVAEALGVRIHLGQEVTQFLVESGRVVGVRLADPGEPRLDAQRRGEGRALGEVRSRVVLSNLDPKRTFLRLFEPQHLDPAFRRRVEGLVTEVSCYKFLAAISELPRWTSWDGDPDEPSRGSVVLHTTRAHVAVMYDDVEAGRPPRAPVISFSVPSAVDPSLAPPGRHTASVWIYSAPAKLREGTWDDVRESVTERLIDQITEYAPNFRASILKCRLRTPLDLERETGLTDGSIWHVQHTAEQLFWNRPLPELAQYRAPLAGLYLCGAGQHPGGEVSGQPGHNAAQEVLKDLDRGGPGSGR
jgi:phytoene dehydrogenase-like protein